MWTLFLETRIAGNEIWRILFFFAAMLASLAAGRLARYFMERSAARLRGQAIPGLLLGALAKPAVAASFAIGWWLGLAALTLASPGIRGAADMIGTVLNAFAVGYALYSLVDIVDHYLHRMTTRTDSKVDDVLAPLVGKSIRITILVLAVVNVVQQISGKSITTILAGLGVGSLAIALAGQDTIKNFFGSLVILMDKPFEIGERIVVDGHDGPVESIGFRSTRLRTFDGHLVTIPNAEMATKTVRNIGKRTFIRRVANLTLTYDTPPEKLRRARDIVLKILAKPEVSHPDFPPRVYFSDFNDASLNLMMIYWFHPPDYWRYMELTERINLEILERFNAEGIDFAFPTQTVYLANDAKRQAALRLLGGAEAGHPPASAP